MRANARRAAAGTQAFWAMMEREVLALYGQDFDTSHNLAAANSEMRAFYSSLFQRVGYLNRNAGGGSLSMLLLVDRPALLGSGGGKPAVRAIHGYTSRPGRSRPSCWWR